MSRDTDAVDAHVVDAGDVATRRAAARTVFKAYATAPSTWAFCALAAAAGSALIAAATGPWSSWLEFVVVTVLYLLTCVVLYALVIPTHVYRAPARADRRLLFVRTSTAVAALVLRTDPRHGALTGDIQAVGAGAWPKRYGAGLGLGEWARDLVHSEGGRLTLTTTPLLAPGYRRHGFADDGRTAGFLIRLASRAR
jgi:hypothetical protein